MKRDPVVCAKCGRETQEYRATVIDRRPVWVCAEDCDE